MSSSYAAANISRILMEEKDQLMHNDKQATLKVERVKGYITKQKEDPTKNDKDKVSWLHIHRLESQNNKFKQNNKDNFFAMTL